VVDSNSPDVARQQQWIHDNIRKADDDLSRMHFANPDAPQNSEGVHPTSPLEQGDSDRASDDSLEGGYGNARPEDEGSGSGQSMGSEGGEEGEEGEGEEKEDGEGDVQPRQSRPPSRPNVSLTQPYSPGWPPRHQSSGSQAPVWSRVARPSEPFGISRNTFAHANGRMYSPSPVQFPRRGSVNSTGSNSSGTSLHRAGSLNSDQYRSSSVAPHNSHNGTERPPTQARDRIASNIGPRERQMSASASPHDRPSLPTYPIVAPRAIPGARPPPIDDAVRFPTSANPGSRTLFSMQRSPEDTRQGIVIPRGPMTPEEGPRGASWSSLHSRRSYGDVNVHRRHNSKGDPRLPPVDGDISDASDDVVSQLDDRQSVRSMRSVRTVRSMELEQAALYWEAEAHRKEEEATRKEEEASKKEDEARRLEEKARQSLEDAKRLEEGARQVEASAKMREAAAQKKEAEAKLKEAEAQKREAAAQKREAEARRKENMARQMEHAARRQEEQARRKEEQARRKEEEARKREDEVRRKEVDARKREDDPRKREEDAREREKLARQKEEEAKRIEQDYELKRREIEQKEADRMIREEKLFRKEQAARLAQEELEARRPADETARLESEATSPVGAEDLSSTPRPPPGSARPGAPGTSPYAPKLDRAEWSRRAEERARQQQEQIESETQAKSGKVLSRDELIRLYENHENKWRQLKGVLLKEAGLACEEGDTRTKEEAARHLEEKAQRSLETVQRFQSGAREAEANARRREAEIQNVEAQLREKERLLKIREVEIQKALQAVNERRDTMNLREDNLRQKSAALRDREEDLSRREAALMQSLAVERQRDGADREADLVSLASESTIRNTAKNTNVGLSSKSCARLKEDSEYYGNEG